MKRPLPATCRLVGAQPTPSCPQAPPHLPWDSSSPSGLLSVGLSLRSHREGGSEGRLRGWREGPYLSGTGAGPATGAALSRLPHPSQFSRKWGRGGSSNKGPPTCASLCQPRRPLAQSLGLLWALPLGAHWVLPVMGEACAVVQLCSSQLVTLERWVHPVKGRQCLCEMLWNQRAPVESLAPAVPGH